MATKLLSEEKTTVEEALKELLDEESNTDGTPEVCEGLLTALRNHPELEAKVMEVIALFGKEVEFRDVAVSCGVVPALCPLLSSDDNTTLLQTLRAIGNLSYEHDGNRELVLTSGGCPLLVKQLTSCNLLPAKKEYDRLKYITCACIMNIVNENVKLSTEMISLNIFEHLTKLLNIPGEDINTISMGLKTLYVLLVAGVRQQHLVIPTSLPPTFSHLLAGCVSGDLTEETLSVLETLEIVINTDEKMKVLVVEAGCVEYLIKISDPLLQMKVIDILIIICADDSSLNLLVKKPDLITMAIKWLTDPASLKRQANTALLCANMARTDEICDLFISRGVVPHLIHLTELKEPEELNGKVHVSALSALRNLCLPDSNKPLLLEKGVLKTALSCLRDSEWPHVHFKCLGIARLLANRQEEVCKELVLSELGTVSLVCERCSKEEPPHIMLEGARLLAAIIKYCKSEEVMKRVVSEGGVKLISCLLQSEHISMKNESLIALNLLAMIQSRDEIMTNTLCDSTVLDRVWDVITNENSSPELITNSLTFLLQLNTQADGVVEKVLSLNEFTEKLKMLSQHNSDVVREKVQQLTEKVSVNKT